MCGVTLSDTSVHIDTAKASENPTKRESGQPVGYFVRMRGPGPQGCSVVVV